MAEAFLASIYHALAESPQWRRTLLVIIYDENGGYFDHVAPPRTVDPRPEFRQLGFRVPALVIGPTAWQGGVVSTELDHTSIAATLRARFGIESLGPRMDAAHDLSGCIDPARLDETPPRRPSLPRVELSGGAALAPPPQATSQAYLEGATAREAPEAHRDPRADAERFKSWLRHAQELDAVRVVR
jgi:phospholipase C